MRTLSPINPTRSRQGALLVVGSSRCTNDTFVLTALELIASSPERLCQAWTGRFVTRLVTDDASPAIAHWAERHELHHRLLFDGPMTWADQFFGLVVVSADAVSFEITEKCFHLGIPCLAADANSMDMFLLSDKDLADWKARLSDSQDKVDKHLNLAADAEVGIINTIGSPFSPDSVTISEREFYEPMITSRDGDRCTFTRSQVARVG